MSVSSRKDTATPSPTEPVVRTPERKKRPETSWTSSSLHHLWSQTSIYQCVTPPTKLLKLPGVWALHPHTHAW